MASPWTEERLQVLVRDRVEENAVLEYKRCDSLQKTDGKRVEISKDVSAFANAAGGEIVYGMIAEDQAPSQLGNGLDPADISKEWLEQVINGKIQPRIDGVRIFPVPLDKSHPGKVAYVVEVPQSLTAHQAADQRYYKRFNFQSIPMEDYEIRDVMNRVKHPRLEPKISYVVDRRQERNGRNRAYQLLISLVNSG